MWFGPGKHVQVYAPSDKKAQKQKQKERQRDDQQRLHEHSFAALKNGRRTSDSKLAPPTGPSKKQLASKSSPNLLVTPPANNHGGVSRPLSAQPEPAHAVASRRVGYMNQSAALVDRISDRMNTVLTSLDTGEPPRDADIAQRQVLPDVPPLPAQYRSHQPLAVGPATKLPSSSHFDRVWLYANSRLPPHLPPLKLYLPTYPILCLAVQHSLSVYHPSPAVPSSQPPTRAKSTISTYHTVPASLRTGTKAMTIATATHDTATSPLVLIAIRGSSTFMDWAVNIRQEPTSPQGFISDAGNLCHAGFLAVAKSMAPRIALELRRLLEEKPERSRASVLLTGHSAGGAVAALLYMHILSALSPAVTDPITSELIDVAQAFKRVHCITFGAPPVSLLPLQRPPSTGNRRIEKSIFFAFVNEGDPVARAGLEYIKSLLCLYTTPPPLLDGWGRGPIWPTPPGVLSTAGRVVLLRPKASKTAALGAGPGAGAGAGQQKRALFKKSSPDLRMQEGARGSAGGLGAGGGLGTTQSVDGTEGKIEACSITDEMLRGVVFGDPMMHAMKLYAERIERMAVDAVTVGGVSSLILA
ncbi:MAG: hypothetical protein Q9162_001503 [Coniocarpon cinnabarinum]